MKTIVCNQVSHLQHYIYFYLKEIPNYFHLNYRDANDFNFFQPDRSLLVINKMEELPERFIRDSKKNKVPLTLITEDNDLYLKSKDLGIGLSFLIREKDNYLNQLYTREDFPKEFNFSNMHLMTPKILSWIKKKKKGCFKFFNKEKYSAEEFFKLYTARKVILGDSEYVEPSEGCEIKEEKASFLDKKLKINIYTATYYRFEKTKKSILNLLQLAKTSKHDAKLYIGDNNTKISEMREWLEKLNQDEELVEVYFSKENLGKAMIINYMDRELARKDYDYIFSIDSDMYQDTETMKKYHTLDEMIIILEKCQNIGLVSSNQSELSQHWYGATVSQKENRGYQLGYTNNGIGVAGGCIVLRKRDWDKIGRYKENHDVYTGDDSILTYNVFRKLGMEAVVAHDFSMVHPKVDDDEKGYSEWKMESWKRDNVNFIKDNYTGKNKKGYYD